MLSRREGSGEWGVGSGEWGAENRKWGSVLNIRASDFPIPYSPLPTPFSLKPFNYILGEVSQDQIGAGAFDSDQRLHHDAFFINPAQPSGGLDLRIFARNLIGGQRQVESLARGS